MELLWSGETVSFEGEFFRLDDVTLPVVSRQEPRIPTVIAGWWPNERPFRRAGRRDGTMPYRPALLGGTVGPEGQTSNGTVDGEPCDLMALYRDVTDELGEVVLPRQTRDDADDRSLAEELGATWLLTSYRMDLDELRQGPSSTRSTHQGVRTGTDRADREATPLTLRILTSGRAARQ